MYIEYNDSSTIILRFLLTSLTYLIAGVLVFAVPIFIIVMLLKNKEKKSRLAQMQYLEYMQQSQAQEPPGGAIEDK